MPLMNITVDAADIRIDKYLAEEIEILSRTKVKDYITKDNVLVDGSSVKPSYLLRGGETIQLEIEEEGPPGLEAENIPLNIVHEDNDIIVLNKPAGLVVHPGAGNRSGTLVNGLIYHFSHLSSLSGALRPGIVHRLDKNTSGIMVVAKTDLSHIRLARQFADRKVNKKYLALVWGVPEKDEGTVDAPIGRNPRNRQKFGVVEAGRRAVTRYRVVEEFDHLSLVELHPETGRTHQLRVHLAFMGHPVFADEVYSGGLSTVRGFLKETQRSLKSLYSLIERQALHALSLSFTHPSTDELVEFVAPLPDDLHNVLSELEPEYE
ncbi:MAG: RNA pseudouridine synthase [Candidatus Marinimicrobia bacterium]|mgnify:CR=1 FL=1|jgi:23S rRNA pseudouridine1911/1915/1917 synthase|nr:RNA pseudouridine synthase [Candidatus Neomarinimicrobiota bacterium]|tara:strand:- start:22866 stop:23825 length:960 start_codon:yes stop_codon:yes gene_type:complete